jgi:hypothetical protein
MYMSKKFIGLTLALALFAVALPASAAGLTQPQIAAIVGLLQAFGAEASVIASVQMSLGDSSSWTGTRVTIDQNSLTTESTNPIIVGMATNTKLLTVDVLDKNGAIAGYNDGRPANVDSNGRWISNLSYVEPGTYTLKVRGSLYEGNEHTIFATGVLRVLGEIIDPKNPPISADVKVNGSDGPVFVKDGQRITVSWSSTGATYCKLGNVRRTANGDIAMLDDLPTKGSRTFYAVGAGFVENSEDSFVSLGCYKERNAEYNPTRSNSAVDLMAVRAPSN